MPETFELVRYLDHLRRRWRVIAAACVVALGVAVAMALIMPARYTATARIIIEPPAGSDLRVTMAVSPIYLESLKTYELMASGDQLFLDAIEHFKLARTKPLDRLKQSVLKVAIPHNTRVLEVSATLPNPAQAQALALYIAEQTVKLTRNISLETERDLMADAERQWTEARARLLQVENDWARLSDGPVGRTPERAAQVDALQVQRDAARTGFELAEKRLQEVRSTSGFRGERLKIVDPGVVPERPSWPNTPLIALSALVLALALSLLYLAIELNYRLEKAATPRAVPPLARIKTQ